MLLLISLFEAFLGVEPKKNIPNCFRALADKAISNSKNKVPKELREDTKHPGFYDLDNVHFKLKQTYSSPTTKDIKGFAKDGDFIAIAKRKAFNITNDFAFADPNQQKIYKMTQLIAYDDDVNIYSSSEISMFDIFTNFHSDLKKTKSNNFELEVQWNKDTNSPELKNIPGYENNGIQYGLGASGTAEINPSFDFNSAKDISIKANIKLNIKIAAEFLIKDNLRINISNKNLFEKQIPIPSIGFSFTFLKVKFEIGTFFKFNTSLTNTYFDVPIGFDYMKGYSFTCSKFFEITPYSVTNSKWEIETTQIKGKNKLDSTINSLLASKFASTLLFKTSLSFQFTMPFVSTNLDIGLQVPFTMNFGFDTKKCVIPYLYGNINIPLRMYYSFGGIKIIKQLIESSENSKELFSISTNKFCLIQSENIEEGDSDIIQTNYDTVYYVEHKKWYMDMNGELSNKPVQLIIRAKNQANNAVITTRTVSYAQYPTSSQYGKDIDSYMLVSSPSKAPKFTWQYIYPDKYSVKSSYEVYYIPDKNYTNLNINIKSDDSKRVLYGSANIYKCQMIDIGKIYSRPKSFSNYQPVAVSVPLDDKKYGVVSTSFFNGAKVSYYYFIPETVSSQSDQQFYEYHSGFDHYVFSFDGLDLSSKADIEIKFILTKNNQSEIIGTINKENLASGIHKSSELGLDDYKIKFYAPKDHDPILTIEGKIVWKSYLIFSDPLDFTFVWKYDNLKSNVNKRIGCIFSDSKTDRLYVKINYINNTLVAIKIPNNGYVPEKEMMVPCSSHLFDKYSGEFQIESDYKYVIFKLLSNKDLIPMSNWRYIVMQSDQIDPISDWGNIVIISPNTFLVNVGSYDYTVLFRKRDINDKIIKIKYLVTDFRDKYNINLSPNGITSLSFNLLCGFMTTITNGVPQYSFINPYNVQPKEVYQMKVDDKSVIISYLFGGVYNFTRRVSFIKSSAYLAEGEPSVTYDTSHICNLTQYYDVKPDIKYQVSVYCDSPDVKAIRFEDQIVELVNGVAKFSFNNECGKYTFYPVCADETGKMCEIDFRPKSGEYHHIGFPSRDGIYIVNESGLEYSSRGMLSGFFRIPSGQKMTYYKPNNGVTKLIKSYGTLNKIKLIATDETTTKQISSNDEIGVSSSYRKFCLVDDDGDHIPFSNRYLTENMDDLMEKLGVMRNYSIDQYEFTDDDCIAVSNEAIVTRVISQLPTSFCDLPSEEIIIDNHETNSQTPDVVNPTHDVVNPTHDVVNPTHDVVNPTAVISPVPENKNKNENKVSFATICIIVGACLVVAVIIVIVIVVVVLKKQKRKNLVESSSLTSSLISIQNEF